MIDATSHTCRRNRASTIALILSCLSLIISLACAGVIAITVDINLLPLQSEPAVASASQVEAVAHITLPPGTVLLGAAYSNGLETMLSAKFRIPGPS